MYDNTAIIQFVVPNLLPNWVFREIQNEREIIIINIVVGRSCLIDCGLTLSVQVCDKVGSLFDTRGFVTFILSFARHSFGVVYGCNLLVNYAVLISRPQGCDGTAFPLINCEEWLFLTST